MLLLSPLNDIPLIAMMRQIRWQGTVDFSSDRRYWGGLRASSPILLLGNALQFG
jgi:hypothetical protein